MKKCKSILSVILCAVMLFTCCVMYSGAEDKIYPESEHEYQNNYYNEWTYTYPEEADGIFVTFSEDTFTEQGEYYSIYFENDEIDLEEVIKNGYCEKVGDYIAIFDSDNNLIGTYQGSELSGKTIYVPGSSFKLSLTTDSAITGYGFKITNVSTEMPEGTQLVRYHLKNGEVVTSFFYRNTSWEDWYASDIDWALYDTVYSLDGLIIDGEAIVGWTNEDGEKLYYKVNTYDNVGALYDFVSDFKEVDLYAITEPVVLQPEDVYSFGNSSAYFNVDGEDNYYMTKEDYLRLISSSCIVNGVGPLALPAAVTSVVLVSYAEWPWDGSCIGFTSTVCQQKAGVLDVVSTQEGATCIKDLKPTPELISLLNYYNGQSFTSMLTKNKALKKYPEEYSRQLKKMFESAQQGNLVLLEFFTGEEISMGYHGVAVSGAYTDEQGNHILLCYDDNFPDYATKGLCKKCVISPDFTSINNNYGEGLGFVWTDDFQSYKSLNIYKVTSPIDYNIGLLRHIVEILVEWFEVYVLGLFK